MNDISDRQAAVLLYIRGHIADRGCPPTMREIGAHMGIRSTNAVNDHLRALERKGFITRRNKQARSIQVLGETPPDAATAEERAAAVAKANAVAKGGVDALARTLREILAEYNVMAVRRSTGANVVDLGGELARRMMKRGGSA